MTTSAQSETSSLKNITNIYHISDAALDWAVAKCMGFKHIHVFEGDILQVMVSNKKDDCYYFNPTNNWAEGGEIIEQEMLQNRMCIKNATLAADPSPIFSATYLGNMWEQGRKTYGPTPLIAAMRCYVVARIGTDIELPEVLKCKNT